MIDETTLNLHEVPGSVGPLFDENPRVTPARVRPFIWAHLLLTGAVRRSEVATCLVPHIAREDQKVFEDLFDRTPLEAVIDDELLELVAEGLLRRNKERRTDEGEDLFVLTPEALVKATSLVCTINGQLPDHLLQEVGR